MIETKRGTWYAISGPSGITYIPIGDVKAATFNDLRPHYDGDNPSGFEVVSGWGMRHVMPDCPDCTLWTLFATKLELDAYLDDLDAADMAALDEDHEDY